MFLANGEACASSLGPAGLKRDLKYSGCNAKTNGDNVGNKQRSNYSSARRGCEGRDSKSGRDSENRAREREAWATWRAVLDGRRREPRGATGGRCAESIYECARLGVVGGWWRRGRLGAWATGSEEEEETGRRSAAAVAQVSRPKQRQAGARGGRGKAPWAASRQRVLPAGEPTAHH